MSTGIRVGTSAGDSLLTLRDIAEKLNTDLGAFRRRSHRFTEHKSLERKSARINLPEPFGWDDELNARLWRWEDVRPWAIAVGFWDGLVDVPIKRRAVAADRMALDVITMPAREWQDDGLCKERPEVDFFDGRSKSTAKRICAECLVRSECLAFALTDPDTQGVWAGYAFPQERRQALKEMSR